MKFTCIPQLGKQGGGTVWNPETNRPLAIFDQNGEYETTDDAVIEALIARGFKVIGGEPAIEPVNEEKPRKTKKHTAE